MNRIRLAILLSLFASYISAQENTNFDVSFRVDLNSAEELLRCFEGSSFSTSAVINQRGTQLAAATSALLARKPFIPDEFRRALESYRSGGFQNDDQFGLQETRASLPQVRALLNEVKKRQIDRRVRATLVSYFPASLRISASIPVYVVAMGNEKAAAFVRRVVWHGETPQFVGNDEGEPVIVLNLARCISNAPLESQFASMLATLAHESFHAVYSRVHENSRDTRWTETAIGTLAELAQNEGIAYLISMQIQIGGTTPHPQWFNATADAVSNFISAMNELAQPGITRQRARELILNANLSGSFEGNYGATAGLRIAYEIESQLGHDALAETIALGPEDFFRKYERCLQRSGLPPLSEPFHQLLQNEHE